MAPPRPADPTTTFYQLDGVPLFCGDGSLSSRLRYIAEVLNRVGDGQSQAVITDIRKEVDALQTNLARGNASSPDVSEIRDRIHQIFIDLSDAFAKAERYRVLALGMARQHRHAGLPLPNGISELILEGQDPSSDGLT